MMCSCLLKILNGQAPNYYQSQWIDFFGTWQKWKLIYIFLVNAKLYRVV